MRTAMSLRVWAPKSKIKCRREPKIFVNGHGLFLFFRMGLGVPYLLQWALNNTGNHHFKEKSKKKVPWAVEYQNDGLSWISPESYERRRAEACVDESAHHALVNAGGKEIV
jgi:hypothetical protein